MVLGVDTAIKVEHNNRKSASCHSKITSFLLVHELIYISMAHYHLHACSIKQPKDSDFMYMSECC